MVIATDYPFLEILWTMLVFFGFVLWFSLLIKVFGDLFRRDDVSGFGKFAWSLVLILVPLIAALFYLGSRGQAMAQRDLEEIRARAEYEAYRREKAGGGGGAGEA